MNEKIYLVLLHSIWITQKKLHYIFKENQNYKFFFENISQKNLSKYKIRTDVITKILEQKNKINKVFIEKAIEERWVSIITIHDENYPQKLREISNPPYLFYLRWHIDDSPSIAVVWSRKISNYWERAIEKIVSPLAKYFTIVSGGAAGCDTRAHKTTLEAWGKTISVVGTWIDVDYPVHNKKTYDEIVQAWWGVMSIFRIWEVGNPYNFPVRNEIVTWLAHGTLVVEAQQKSWSLITAQLCLDLWRDLFAIPGDIYKSGSIWCNNLIKAWAAKLTTSAMDILEEYNFSREVLPERKEIVFSSHLEKSIYNIISIESLNSNEISKKLDLNINEILKTLSLLEIQWIIKTSIGWKYVIW